MHFPARYAKVLERLDRVKEVPSGGWKCSCPAHDDVHPSMTVKVGDTGALLLKCHRNNGAGCSVSEILDAVGCTLADVFPESTRLVAQKKLESVHNYRNAEEQTVYQVCKYRDDDGKKRFLQRRPNPVPGGEAWIWNIHGVQRILYNLPQILKLKREAEAKGEKATVCVVEGEGAADSLTNVGIPATCNPCGAGKLHLCDYSPLADCHVCVFPDNDAMDPLTKTWTGQAHAEEVCRLLYPIALTVRYVDLHGLPVKGDAFDWVEYRNECKVDRKEIQKEFWKWSMAKPIWVPPQQPHPLFSAAESLSRRLTPASKSGWKRDILDAADEFCECKDPAEARKLAFRLAAILLAGGETFLDIKRPPRSYPMSTPDEVPPQVEEKNQAS